MHSALAASQLNTHVIPHLESLQACMRLSALFFFSFLFFVFSLFL